jgi:hypothetical protein
MRFVLFYIHTFFFITNYFSVWIVSGGMYGLTCPEPVNYIQNGNGTILCKNLSIPDCVDRTVYCTNPPDSVPAESVTIINNPSSTYKRAPGFNFTKILRAAFYENILRSFSLIIVWLCHFFGKRI